MQKNSFRQRGNNFASSKSSRGGICGKMWIARVEMGTVSWGFHLAADKRMSWVSALERVGGCKTGGSMFYNAPLLPSFATVFLKRERDGLLLNVIMLL